MARKSKSQLKSFLYKNKKALTIIFIVILGAGFIPFEREFKDIKREYTLSFSDVINYKEKEYYDSNFHEHMECIYDARWKSYEEYSDYEKEATYKKLADKCDKAFMINTGKVINRIRLGDGLNVTTNDEYEDRDIYIGDDNKLYWNHDERRRINKQGDVYFGLVDYVVTSGSSITMIVRWTVTCRGFGLICDYGDKNSHESLVFGKDAIIKQYSNVCDYYYPEYPLNGTNNCIYENDKPEKVIIDTVLKQIDK